MNLNVQKIPKLYLKLLSYEQFELHSEFVRKSEKEGAKRLATNDICLIKLPKSIDGGRTPCMLPKPGTGTEPATGKEQIDKYHGAQCWVAGWGHTFWKGQLQDTPRSVGLNLLKRDYCIQHRK